MGLISVGTLALYWGDHSPWDDDIWKRKSEEICPEGCGKSACPIKAMVPSSSSPTAAVRRAISESSWQTEPPGPSCMSQRKRPRTRLCPLRSLWLLIPAPRKLRDLPASSLGCLLWDTGLTWKPLYLIGSSSWWWPRPVWAQNCSFRAGSGELKKPFFSLNCWLILLSLFSLDLPTLPQPF